MLKAQRPQNITSPITCLWYTVHSRSVYTEERYHNKGGERERDVAKNFWFLKQNFQVTRLMTYLS